jgi:hypothetical protein
LVCGLFVTLDSCREKSQVSRFANSKLANRETGDIAIRHSLA